MAWVGQDIKACPTLTLCHGQGHPAVNQDAQSPIQPDPEHSMDGSSTASLVNLWRCRTILTVENYFLILIALPSIRYCLHVAFKATEVLTQSAGIWFAGTKTLRINWVLWKKGFAMCLHRYSQGWIASLPLLFFPNLFFLSMPLCTIANTTTSV